MLYRKLRYSVFLTLIAVTVGMYAEERCRVIITSENETVPFERAIEPVNEWGDSGNAIKTKLENGSFECTVVSSWIRKYKIYDLGEMKAKGSTLRLSTFFVEDGATIKASLDGDDIRIESDGKEQNKWNRIQEEAYSMIRPEYEKAEKIGDESQREAEIKKISESYYNHLFKSYASDKSVGFLIELEDRLNKFRFNDYNIGKLLEIYHDCYSSFHPELYVHEKIANTKLSVIRLLEVNITTIPYVPRGRAGISIELLQRTSDNGNLLGYMVLALQEGMPDRERQT